MWLNFFSLLFSTHWLIVDLCVNYWLLKIEVSLMRALGESLGVGLRLCLFSKISRSSSCCCFLEWRCHFLPLLTTFNLKFMLAFGSICLKYVTQGFVFHTLWGLSETLKPQRKIPWCLYSWVPAIQMALPNQDAGLHRHWPHTLNQVCSRFICLVVVLCIFYF